MNEVGLVISRYWQTLKWIEEIKFPIDIYIYDRRGSGPPKFVCQPNYQTPEEKDRFLRGETDLGFDINIVKNNGVNVEIIEIEDDRGYDGSTYLHHCYSKHDSLNNFTLFMQGHGYTYRRDIIHRINNIELLKHTHFISAGVGLFPLKEETIEKCIEFEPISDRSGWVLPYSEYGWEVYKTDFTKAPWWEFCKSMPDWNNGLPPKEGWAFGEGSQFIVCKERVLKHNADYYKQIQHFVNTYLHPNTQTTGWLDRYYGLSIMEGLWQWIF